MDTSAVGRCSGRTEAHGGGLDTFAFFQIASHMQCLALMLQCRDGLAQKTARARARL